MKPEGDYLQSTWEQSVYPMADLMEIDIFLPKVSPQPHTNLAFEGYQYAKEKDRGNEYNERMLRAFFQEEKDIGNINILTKLAGEIGVDEKEYREVLTIRRYKDAHEKALKHAYEANITAVPTFVIGATKLQGFVQRKRLNNS